MFERYTEKARRAIFFARYEASQFGSSSIETEHLLLGLLEDKALVNQFLPLSATVEAIRKQIESRTHRREKISTAVDMPLSHECKRALDYSAEEAGALDHKHVGTEHMLLGLLREEQCFATQILRERGLQLSQVRETITRGGAMSPTVSQRDKIRMAVSAYLTARQQEWGVSIALESPVGSHAPDIVCKSGHDLLVCIDVLLPEVPFGEVIDRVEDYLAMGARYVWLLDPVRRAYVATVETGLREIKDQALRTENPVLELPLDEVFV